MMLPFEIQFNNTSRQNQSWKIKIILSLHNFNLFYFVFLKFTDAHVPVSHQSNRYGVGDNKHKSSESAYFEK